MEFSEDLVDGKVLEYYRYWLSILNLHLHNISVGSQVTFWINDKLLNFRIFYSNLHSAFYNV